MTGILCSTCWTEIAVHADGTSACSCEQVDFTEKTSPEEIQFTFGINSEEAQFILDRMHSESIKN